MIQRGAFIFLLAMAIVVAFRLFGRKQLSPTSGDPNVFMPAMAARAVVLAGARGVDLDYSPDSIKAVESILGELRNSRARGAMTDEEVTDCAFSYGGYIGEIIRKKYNGVWARDSAAAGPASFPVIWEGKESYPVGWCGKRIINGDEDNVWSKYQIVTSDKQLMSGLPTSKPEQPILKIAVFSDGRLTIGGTPANIDQVREAFQRLAEQRGVVWYYREAGIGEPPPIAMQIIQEVVKARLPIRLSSRADYSDAIGPNGPAKPPSP